MKTNRQVLQHDEGHPVWPLSKRKGGTVCCNGFTWTFYRKQAKMIVKSANVLDTNDYINSNLIKRI